MLEGPDQVRWEIYLKAMIDWDWRSAERQSIQKAANCKGGTLEAKILLTGKLVIMGMQSVEYNKDYEEMRDSIGTGDSESWVDVVLGTCSAWYMQYLVYAVLGICCTQC
jgi:hypothetical protein